MTSRALESIPEADPELLARATELATGAPEPAVIGNVRFGTAGWTDKTLIASHAFYPKGTTTSPARLQYYARHFAMVEVDATYYTLVPPETARGWLQTTAESFVFDVKAHPILTGHPIEVARLPPDLKQELTARGHERRVYPDKMPSEIASEIESRFAAFLEPLHAAGRLGCVMLQFPPWFTATRGNARRLEELAERMAQVPLAVEFRHPSWLSEARRERVLELLGRYHITYIGVDEPDVERGGVPPLLTVTNPELAIVRFHGKNRAGWQKRGATVHERFDYLYAPEELRQWTDGVVELSRRARQVHAVFNNCVRNYAVLGAKGLSSLLAGGST
jgi:uncharacterized protein YecE (DUF72 family)